ncbi:hypothetical protein ONA92_04120 [Mycobacteroides salmoniphilum]|uniref:hypothetical protein n=1 Tax=Mycobacteroides salmoniphilum TaxID=404941 RepID=UPI00356857C2
MSGVLAVLRRTGVLWWRCWPMLIGIYLLGWLARHWLIELAVVVTVHFGGFWGMLIMPLAVLARLVTYISMFWVLAAGTGPSEDGGLGTIRQPFVNVVLRSTLPVFTLFAAWRLILEDYRSYVSQSSFEYLVSDESTGLSADQLMAYLEPGDWRLYAIIVVAFLARATLTKFKDRIPSWTRFLTVYFEALWVWLVVQAASKRLIGSPVWFGQRRVVHWYNTQKDELLARFGVLADGWELLTKTVGLLVPAVLLAMTWIAIAGAIYAVRSSATWVEAGHGMFGERHGERLVRGAGQAGDKLTDRWRRFPVLVQSKGAELFRSLLGILETLAGTIRLVLHSGPLVGSFFVCVFTLLVLLDPTGAYFNGRVSDGYLWRLVVEVIGPHDWEWWQAYRDTIRAGINACVEPVRITFVAAMYGHCVHALQGKKENQDIVLNRTI